MNNHPVSPRTARFLGSRPLLRELIYTGTLTLVILFLLTPASNAMRELSYGLSSDVETKGRIADILCSLLAGGLFYLTSFLSTAVFFVGASFAARLMYRRHLSRAAGAGGILFFVSCLSPILTFAAYVVVKLSADDPQTVTLTDGVSLLGQIGFVLLRVLLVLTVCFLCVALPKRPVRYAVCALLCGAVMTFFSFGIEIFDSLLPIIREGDITLREIASAAFSFLLYVLHGALGVVILCHAAKTDV